MTTYYKDQLLSIVTGNSQDSLKLQIKGDKGETRWLNLNLDSIEALRIFLDDLETSKRAKLAQIYANKVHFNAYMKNLI